MATKSKPKAKAKAKTKLKTTVKVKAKAPRTLAKRVTSDSVPSMRPLEDRIIVRISPPAERTAGGLIIPGTASEEPSEGKVIAAGPGRRSKKGVVRPLDVKSGDTVVFPKFTGLKISVAGEEFLILREEEVLGIVT